MTRWLTVPVFWSSVWMTMMLGLWVAASAPEANPSAIVVATISPSHKRTIVLKVMAPGRVSCGATELPVCSGGDRLGFAADVAGLGGGAVELLVRHHRRSLERKLAVDLDPRAAAVVLVADTYRDRARNPVHPQEQNVYRMAPLPLEALVRVVLRPDVERGEAVDDPRIARLEVIGDLGP